MSVTEKQLADLETFFSKAKLPKEVQLDPGTKVADVNQFIDSHLNVLRHSGDKPVFDGFYNRLLQLKELVK